MAMGGVHVTNGATTGGGVLRYYVCIGFLGVLVTLCSSIYIHYFWRLLPESSSMTNIEMERFNLTVAKDGSGDCSSISDAVRKSPINSDVPYLILIRAGEYHENVLIPVNRKNLRFVGESMESTIIVGNLSFKDTNRTLDTATLLVHGDHFSARDITILNTAGHKGHQAVAVTVTADQVAFFHCNISANQDTLYVHRGRQFYRECIIEGTVDFIFGHGAAVLQYCKIVAKKPSSPKNSNFITADGRVDFFDATGLSIENCRIEASPVPGWNAQATTYLGRPWSDFSKTAFIRCHLSDVIHRHGWFGWDNKEDKGVTMYGEYENVGPGASTLERVNWTGYWPRLSHELLRNFSARVLIGGDSWLHATGFPYSLDIEE